MSAHPGAASVSRGGPPGWPRGVPPPDAPGWERAATSWLLDQCPADFRAYDAWRRHPRALAWVAVWHVNAQLDAMREAYRRVRVELGDDLSERALPQVMEHLAAEGLRLRATARSVELVHEAMQGKRYVPRL